MLEETYFRPMMIESAPWRICGRLCEMVLKGVHTSQMGQMRESTIIITIILLQCTVTSPLITCPRKMISCLVMTQHSRLYSLSKEDIQSHQIYVHVGYSVYIL